MLKVNMISSGENVKGQGVGAAYKEIVRLLETRAKDEISLSFNDDKGCQLNHVHTVHPKCFTLMKLSKLPSCMHVHFLPETLEGSIQLPKIAESVYHKYVLTMYRSADELVVVNPIFIDPLTKYGIDREKITYIPNVVSTDQFYPEAEEELAPSAEMYGIKKDRFNVIGVGQVQTRKGVLDFAEIARRLPDMEFYWAGGFSFGIITDGYKELSELMDNPPKNLHFLGIVDRSNMNDLYNLCDCLLMTSYNELFPMAILEGVNAGIPLLLRDLDLYKMIYFSDYPRAYDNDRFMEQLIRLRDDSNYYKEAKQASFDIADYYSEERIVRLWVDYYKRIIEKYDRSLSKSSAY